MTKKIPFAPELQIEREDKFTVPLVGWHRPTADFEYDGKKYCLSITGGCQGIRIDRVGDGPSLSFRVDVSEILTAMMELLKEKGEL